MSCAEPAKRVPAQGVVSRMPEDAITLPESCVPANGTMRAVEAGGEKILLTRFGGEVHAIGATCPHAGAPLAEGVLHQGRIVCPWHKAEFCTKTGKLLSPPAVDDLPGYSIERGGGELRLRKTTPRQPGVRDPADTRCFVVVGGGAAGAMAVQTLREAGFGGRIVLIDSIGRVPYDRTLLSKYTLSGESGGEKTPLHKQEYYTRQGIERLAAEVIRIDKNARQITCADGTCVSFDALLLAPGASPIHPDLPGADLTGVHLLRSREDAEAIVAAAERSSRVIVLGASFIGMEVAAALRERGLSVTIAGREQQPFERQLGAEVGAAFVDLHREHGVVFRLGADITGIVRDTAGLAVMLGSGEVLSADFVVLGFGVRPATDFAVSLPRNEDDSFTVDATLCVTEGIYAAGDVARFPLHGDGDLVRVEHWRVAQQQGRIAALNMLGQNVPYDATPVFWTIQYMKRLDYIGHAAAWDEIVVHGDLRRRDFLIYYIKNGIVAAAAGFGRDRETAALVVLMDKNRSWRPEELGASPARLLQA